ncbi:MAG: folate-binding protein YgfZ [Rubrivivax sp.]|nr:folate-binding protein YgfZ [Rubrivivax sp.]
MSSLSDCAPGASSTSHPGGAAPDGNPCGALRLTDWGVIRARGDDAESFLQGQLTNDVSGLRGGSAAVLAGYCSAKGRLLATFVVWRDDADDFLLACSADLLAPTLKRLSMYVLRARCKLSDATADVPLWGLAGAAAVSAFGANWPQRAWEAASLQGAGRLIRFPDALADAGVVPRALLAGGGPPAALPALDASAWRWLEARSGTARIVAATVEQFVPQMVNLELVGGVSFRKGCYPGQEVVARSEYRGTLKRRAYVLRAAAALEPGQEVFHSEDPGQPAGLVVLGGGHAGTFAGLVELKIAATAGGSLHLGSADGPLLTFVDQPYALPAAAA